MDSATDGMTRTISDGDDILTAECQCGEPATAECEPVVSDNEGGLCRGIDDARVPMCAECAAVAREYPLL